MYWGSSEYSPKELISWKLEKSKYDTLFDETKIKLLISSSRPRIHEVISLESIREKTIDKV